MNRKELIDFANGIKELCVENGRLEQKAEFRENYVKELEAEVRKLKYEYPTSLLERDKPLPVKWRKKTFHDGQSWVDMLCPKCGNRIANWYRYCNHCGQRIAEENLLPENEVNDEDSNS